MRWKGPCRASLTARSAFKRSTAWAAERRRGAFIRESRATCAMRRARRSTPGRRFALFDVWLGFRSATHCGVAPPGPPSWRLSRPTRRPIRIAWSSASWADPARGGRPVGPPRPQIPRREAARGGGHPGRGEVPPPTPRRENPNPLAALLFQCLTAEEPPGANPAEATPIDALLWQLAGRSGPIDLETLVTAGDDLAAPLWEAAVVRAAQRGLAADAGTFEGGTEELQVAAGLMRCRRGLSRGDWLSVGEALEEISAASSRLRSICQRALASVLARRFPESIRTDPPAALDALTRAARSEATPALLHDMALWRTATALLPEGPLRPEEVGALFESWADAAKHGALVHPAQPAPVPVLEDELQSVLARVLNLVAAADAESVKAAVQDKGGPLGKAALQRAGWTRPPSRKASK